MTSLAGQLLIAAPEMLDDYFSETVILIFQHSEEGAAGVVLNRPSEVRFDTIWNDLDPNHPLAGERVNVGGPCEGPLIAIHSSLAYAEIPVIPGVAMTVGIDNLRLLVQDSHPSVRLYSGYAGWSPDQLESEILQGGWYSIEADSKFVFEDPVDLWRIACARFGDQIITPLAGTHVPADPSMN